MDDIDIRIIEMDGEMNIFGQSGELHIGGVGSMSRWERQYIP